MKQIYFLAIFAVNFYSSLFGQSFIDRAEIIKTAPVDTGVSFRGIFALSENEVWVSGSKGGVYHTRDGGSSFKKSDIYGSKELDFRDIHCLGNHRIIIMGAGNGRKSRIYRSTDGGTIWKMAYQNTQPEGFFNSIVFADNSHGYILGDPVGGRLTVLRTKDGGENWEPLNPDGMPAVLKDEYCFAASGTCITTVGDKLAWIGTGGSTGRIFKTGDGGENWKVFDTPVLSGRSSTGIFSVYFKNESEGIIVGGDYTKETDTDRTAAITRNGGKNWELVGNGVIPYQSCVGEVIVENKSYYVSTGPSGIFISKEGTVWEKLSEEGYHCLSVPAGKKTVWFAGSEGRVAKLIFN